MKTLLSITFILASVVGYSQTSSTSDWQTYTKGDYKIQYPGSWTLDTTQKLGVEFLLFAPKDSDSDQFHENINFIIQDLTGMNLDLDKYTKISLEQLNKLATNCKIYESSTITTVNGSCQKLVFTATQGKFKLEFEQLYFIKNDKAYVLTLTTEQDKFEAYKINGEKIFNSFKVGN
jgi:hypothetical protein